MQAQQLLDRTKSSHEYFLKHMQGLQLGRIFLLYICMESIHVVHAFAGGSEFQSFVRQSRERTLILPMKVTTYIRLWHVYMYIRTREY